MRISLSGNAVFWQIHNYTRESLDDDTDFPISRDVHQSGCHVFGIPIACELASSGNWYARTDFIQTTIIPVGYFNGVGAIF